MVDIRRIMQDVACMNLDESSRSKIHASYILPQHVYHSEVNVKLVPKRRVPVLHRRLMISWRKYILVSLRDSDHILVLKRYIGYVRDSIKLQELEPGAWSILRL